jgi:hypothetical protein
MLACPEGLEPPTCCLEGSCSIQLSYGQPVVQREVPQLVLSPQEAIQPDLAPFSQKEPQEPKASQRTGGHEGMKKMVGVR